MRSFNAKFYEWLERPIYLLFDASGFFSSSGSGQTAVAYDYMEYYLENGRRGSCFNFPIFRDFTKHRASECA
jgi:hypothetical protein